jgi:hypothetical protein
MSSFVIARDGTRDSVTRTKIYGTTGRRTKSKILALSDIRDYQYRFPDLGWLFHCPGIKINEYEIALHSAHQRCWGVCRDYRHEFCSIRRVSGLQYPPIRHLHFYSISSFISTALLAVVVDYGSASAAYDRDCEPHFGWCLWT